MATPIGTNVVDVLEPVTRSSPAVARPRFHGLGLDTYRIERYYQRRDDEESHSALLHENSFRGVCGGVK